MQKQSMIKWKKLDVNAKIPEYETNSSAGMDVRSIEEVVIKPGKNALIKTGLSLEIEPGYEVQVRPRSGLAAKNLVTVLNTPGTIDSDFRGHLKVILINFGDKDFKVKKGDRIAQLVLAPCVKAINVEVDDLDRTVRGEGGFGSTGIG